MPLDAALAPAPLDTNEKPPQRRPREEIQPILVEAALLGLPMPRNIELQTATGWPKGTVREALRRLEKDGVVRIEEADGNRRVQHVGTGLWSDWNTVRTPEKKTPADFVTPAMADVMRALHRVVRANGAMPTYPELKVLAGRGSRSSARRMLVRLEEAGYIVIERRGSERRVQLVETGAWTEWGDARPGHQAFTLRERGSPPPADTSRPPRPRTAASPPKAAVLPPVDTGAAITARLSLPTASARTCQFITTPDDHPRYRPVTHCGQPSAIGSSFCSHHHGICYPVDRGPARVRPDVKARHANERGPRYLLTATARNDVLASLAQQPEGDRVYSTEALFG